jgi:transcriptional regulator with XRE-family HTH domain
VLKKRRSNDILISCGSQIKYYRKLKGFTQEQVSAQLDMDFSQYGKIERGLTNITLSTLSDIAVALDVEPAYLLKKKSNQTKSAKL